MQQSRGWEHYALHRPEPHILLFRRPLGTVKKIAKHFVIIISNSKFFRTPSPVKLTQNSKEKPKNGTSKKLLSTNDNELAHHPCAMRHRIVRLYRF